MIKIKKEQITTLIEIILIILFILIIFLYPFESLIQALKLNNVDIGKIFRFIIISGIVSLVLYLVFKIKKSKMLHIINGYLIFAIFLMSIIFFIAFQIYISNFKPQIPFSVIPIQNEEFKSITKDNILETSYITCFGEVDNFVVNERLMCDFSISFKDNTSLKIDNIKVDGVRGSDENIIIPPSLSNDTYQVVNFPLFLGEEGRNKFLIRINLLDKKKGETYTFYRYTLNLDVLSYKEYNEWKTKKLTYLVGILSVALFSVLSAVSNLKYIMEQKK